jgi:hypothetical protein
MNYGHAVSLTEMAARGEGERAGAAGEPESENPYPEYSDEGYGWRRGWTVGRRKAGLS